jgi:nicotinate-nucleotide pyrophosphorylase (carboxylating)
VEAGEIFGSRKLRAKWNFAEGQKVRRGKTVCALSGQARSILACERVALNYLMLLSGIATKSRAASEKYGKWRISATRKTLPLLSHSEKRAVAIGGCLTHRLSLSDGILAKDNHVAIIMGRKKCGREEAVRLAVSSFPPRAFVEAEVSSASEAIAAAEGGARAILVDNVSPSGLQKIAKAARRVSPKIIIEASGGITLANAGKYLKAGADFCSTSELTMKVEPANLSIEIDF